MCVTCHGSGLVKDQCGDTGRSGALMFCDCDEGRYQQADERRHIYPQPASSAWLLDQAIDAHEAKLKSLGLRECSHCPAPVLIDGPGICDDCKF